MDFSNANIYGLIEKYGKDKVFEVLSELNPEVTKALYYNWKFFAKSYQLMPDNDPWFGYFMYSGRGTGKALRNDTPILTTKGWSTMGQLTPYDDVFDEQGNPCRITGKFSPTQAETNGTYAVTFQNGKTKHTFNTCGDHLWGLIGKETKKLVEKTGFGDWVSLGKANQDYTVKPVKELINSYKNTTLYLGPKPTINTLSIADADFNFFKSLRWLQDLDATFTHVNKPSQFHFSLLRDLKKQGHLVFVPTATPDKIARAGVMVRGFIKHNVEDARNALKMLGESPGEIREYTYPGKGVSKKPYYRFFITPTKRSVGKLLCPLSYKKRSYASKLWKLVDIKEVPYDAIGYSCITVDSPNNLYLAGEGLLATHNTWTGANWTIERARKGKGPMAIMGQTRDDTRDYLVDGGESSITVLSPPDFRPTINWSKRRITWPNGVYATMYSGDEPEQTRGFSGETAWMDEVAKWEDPETAVTNLIMGTRKKGDPRFLITTTPKPIPIIKKLYNDPNVYKITAATYDNWENLAPQYLAYVESTWKGTTLERQELYGEILWESEFSPFLRKDIDQYRVGHYPLALKRKVVSIDPSGSAHRKSDECGMVVCGIDSAPREHRHGFLLEDASGKMSVQEWAKKAIDLYHKWNCDYIVIETNYGGRMAIEPLLNLGFPESKIKEVRATKGKLVRAEPVGLLMQQGRLHIVGFKATLEEELCSFDKFSKESPGRLDAFVWGFSFLFECFQGGGVKHNPLPF